MILVTGATGTVGLDIVEKLAGGSEPSRLTTHPVDLSVAVYDGESVHGGDLAMADRDMMPPSDR